MRKFALVALLATPLLAASCGEVDSTPKPLTDKQQVRLDKELKNRIAGDPVNCISRSGSDGVVRISDSQLLYKPGGKIYLNNLVGSCPGLARDSDIIVTETFGGQLCRGDLIKLVDRVSGMQGPVCSLGEFIPYAKAKG